MVDAAWIRPSGVVGLASNLGDIHAVSHFCLGTSNAMPFRPNDPVCLSFPRSIHARWGTMSIS